MMFNNYVKCTGTRDQGHRKQEFQSIDDFITKG